MLVKAFFKLSSMWQIILNWALQMVCVSQMYFPKPLTHWSPSPNSPRAHYLTVVRRKNQAPHGAEAGAKPFRSAGAQMQTLSGWDFSFTSNTLSREGRVSREGYQNNAFLSRACFLNLLNTNTFLKASRNLNLVRNFEMNCLACPQTVPISEDSQSTKPHVRGFEFHSWCLHILAKVSYFTDGKRSWEENLPKAS